MKQWMIFSFTEKGSEWNKTLLDWRISLGDSCKGYTVSRYAKKYGLAELPADWKDEIGRGWGETIYMFIGATGIAIRAVAPFVKDKFADSPVLSMDEKGQFILPLLSGHIGGAVELAKEIGKYISAQPVITTATDVENVFAVDVYAKKKGLCLDDREKAREISAMALDGTLDLKTQVKEVDTFPPMELREKDCIYLAPKNIYVGIGCKKGIYGEHLRKMLHKVLDRLDLKEVQICEIGSIDLKAEEPGILELKRELGVPFRTFSAGELSRVETVSQGSDFVKKVTGVDNVCERAAKLLCPNGNMLQPKMTMEGCTFAIVQDSKPAGSKTAAKAQKFEGLKEEEKTALIKILIFSGTTEGRELVEFLADYPVQVYASVATDYGKECMKPQGNLTVLTGRMDEPDICDFLKKVHPDLVIDATHPFARVVTENIKAACGETKIDYLRCLREKGGNKHTDKSKPESAEQEPDMGQPMDWMNMDLPKSIVVGSVQEAADFLAQTKGKILITTGSKELACYQSIPNYKERCYARVLSTEQAVKDSHRLGFEGAHLIAMQGPFSVEMNVATLKLTQAEWFVTKESGKNGGYEEKVRAAQDAGVHLVVVGRPEETGESLEQVKEILKDRFGDVER